MRIYLRDVLRQTVLPEARAPGPARLRAEKGYSLSEREYPFLLLPSAALLIFRAAAQRKKCRMAARSPLTRQPPVCHVSADCVRYRPQHCLFSALLCSAKNAGWQLARRWRGSRSYAAYQQAASVTVRSTAYFPRCCAAQKMPDGSSFAADAAAARMPRISRLRP